MKHFYKLLFIFCLTSGARSQVNSYFNNNPCWQARSMCQIASNCYTVDVYNYFTNGDTLIGAYQYKKVYKKGYSYAQYGAMGPPPSGNPCLSPPPTYYYSAALSFFIRSAGKKMYVLNAPFTGGPSCGGDTLLYDFNLQVGDTLPTTCNNPWTSNTFTVTAIDSINTLNGWMKRFRLNNNPSYDLIEGMGYMNGLVELMPPNVMSCGWNLQCYSQNNTAYYPSAGPSCLLATNISETQTMQKPFVYPNPSGGNYKVFLNEMPEGLKIEVYTATGQLIRSYAPQSQILEIDLSKEAAGIYMLHCNNNGAVTSVKLIKN